MFWDAKHKVVAYPLMLRLSTCFRHVACFPLPFLLQYSFFGFPAHMEALKCMEIRTNQILMGSTCQWYRPTRSRRIYRLARNGMRGRPIPPHFSRDGALVFGASFGGRYGVMLPLSISHLSRQPQITTQKWLITYIGVLGAALGTPVVFRLEVFNPSISLDLCYCTVACHGGIGAVLGVFRPDRSCWTDVMPYSMLVEHMLRLIRRCWADETSYSTLFKCADAEAPTGRPPGAKWIRLSFSCHF